jgi:hypothetical protein
MYVLEQLQQKSLKELKEIGWQLNVMPEADKRCRQNWINALVGLNPPLLQLLENSPAASVEQVEEPIMETVDASPGVELEPVQEPPLESPAAAVECPFCGAVHALYTDKDCLDKPLIRCLHCHYCRIKNYPGPIRFEAQEPIRETVETFPGVEFDPLLGAIVPAAETSFGSRSKALTAHQLLELFKSSAHIIEDSPGVKTEATVSESAIAPAAKISLDAESDQNSILTGITLSDRFLAHYSPPQAQIIHFQSDADGQLSLLNFEIESVDEPPDPDDFESLDAFREAIARWDFEHNEVSLEHNEVNPEHNEPLQVSLDSFCLWVHCPHTWYEAIGLHLSEVMELLRVGDSSDTSNFFIPTFGALGDRTNRRNSDEPSTAGVGARLLKPSPPSFPPMTACQPQLKRIPNAGQTQICCILAGSSTQPARSPPGGDAGF